MIRFRFTLFCLLLALPGVSSGQVVDTAGELSKLVSVFKNFGNIGYAYVMDGSFPGGQKDQAKGNTYIDVDGERYFNDCDAFMLFYSTHWYYKADHREKTLTIVNLENQKNSKLKKGIEKDIFKNKAVLEFLDSVVVRKAKVRKISHDGEVTRMVLDFPKSMTVQKMEVGYNTNTNFPVSYLMQVVYPLQNTANGAEKIATTITCTGFSKNSDAEKYNEEQLFTYQKGKIELKKYNNYKLITKM